jgi:hypothetical protein
MLKTAAQSAAILVFVLVVLFFGFLLVRTLFPPLQPVQQGKTEQPQQYNAEENENRKPAESFWQRPTNDPVAFFTLWIAAFTALLVLVSAFQIGFLISANDTATEAANAAKISADIAKRTLTELERPYIFVDIPKFIPSPIKDRPNVQYVLKNYGRTPAIVRWLKATAQTDPPGNQGPIWQEIFNGQIAFKPGEEKEVEPIVRTPFPYPIAPAIRNPQEPFMLLIIEITYSDVFDYMHVSEFTFFESSGSFHAIAGKKYNRSKSEKLPEGVEWTPAWSEKPR